MLKLQVVQYMYINCYLQKIAYMYGTNLYQAITLQDSLNYDLLIHALLSIEILH